MARKWAYILWAIQYIKTIWLKYSNKWVNIIPQLEVESTSLKFNYRMETLLLLEEH